MSAKYFLLNYTDRHLEESDVLFISENVNAKFADMAWLNDSLITEAILDDNFKSLEDYDLSIQGLSFSAWKWVKKNKVLNNYIVILLPNNPMFSFILAKNLNRFPINTFFGFFWNDRIALFHKDSAKWKM